MQHDRGNLSRRTSTSKGVQGLPEQNQQAGSQLVQDAGGRQC